MTLDDFRRPRLIDHLINGTLGAKWYYPKDSSWYGVWGYYNRNREVARHELQKAVSAWFMGEDGPTSADLEASSDAGFAFDVG